MGFYRPRSKIVTAMIALFIWIIVGFNTYTPDYPTYEYIYKQVSVGIGLSEFEPLFTLLMLICIKAGLSFQGFRIVFALIYTLVALAAVQKLNENNNINLVLVMFMLWPLIPNVSGIRFSLASMIVCYFIPNLAENNIKYTIRYLLGVFIATFIHMSSVFYIILILAQKKMTSFKRIAIFSLIISAILVLYSNIPLLIISKFFDGVTSRKLIMWLVTSSQTSFKHNSILGFMAFSFFVIAFSALVGLMSKQIIKIHAKKNIESYLSIKHIILYRNISCCMLLIIPGFVIAGIYERFLFGILPVYYSVFSKFTLSKHNRSLIYSKLFYSFCFIVLVFMEILFYIYSNTYVSNNFNLYDVFKNNMLL